MTPRDIAIGLAAMLVNFETSKDNIDRIEQVITAAIKDEREACAALVEECNLELKPGVITKRTRKDYELCKSLAEQIRARSERKD